MRFRATIFTVEEDNKYYTFLVCVCSLRYPTCNAHAPYCHLWPAPLYNIFPHYLINCTIFGKEKLLNTKCVFWFSLQLLCETFLILRRTERDMIKNVYWSYLKYLLFWFHFNETWIFSTDFGKNCRIPNLTKISAVGVEPFHADGRTDMTKLIVAFHNFPNAPKSALLEYLLATHYI